MLLAFLVIIFIAVVIVMIEYVSIRSMTQSAKEWRKKRDDRLDS